MHTERESGRNVYDELHGTERRNDHVRAYVHSPDEKQSEQHSSEMARFRSRSIQDICGNAY